jgi:hypothetical protein
MNLSAARSELASIITAVAPNDWGVTDHLPDSVAPPCILIGWAEPWLKVTTSCFFETAIEVLCVAQRIEPGGKLETLEQMVSTLLPALKRTAFNYIDVTSPYPLEINGVTYLAASINITHDLEN